jgi:nitrogen regulatory protein P-II 1
VARDLLQTSRTGGTVRRVVVITRHSKLDAVRDLLGRVGVDGMTVTEVRGFGRQRGHSELYRAAEYSIVLQPKLRLEIVVEDGRAPALNEEIQKATWTGKIGDGKIFVTPVEDAIRIRTGERGYEAL